MKDISDKKKFKKDAETTVTQNLMEGSAGFKRLEAIPKNDVTARVTIGQC